jgi:hypothetical protein
MQEVAAMLRERYNQDEKYWALIERTGDARSRARRLSSATRSGSTRWMAISVTRWQMLEGHPPDEQPCSDAIDHPIEQFGHPPWRASADRGVYSPDNETYAIQRGVKQPILPKPGRKTSRRRQHEAQSWFKRSRRYHAGIEEASVSSNASTNLTAVSTTVKLAVTSGWAEDLAAIGHTLVTKAA